MSETKPPTPGEIAEARKVAEILGSLRQPTAEERTAIVLLAALDAETARATAAEKSDARATRTIERLVVRAETAERERDEARAALKPFAKIEVPTGASDGTWVATTLHCGDQVTAHSVWAARAALGLGKEAPRG